MFWERKFLHGSESCSHQPPTLGPMRSKAQEKLWQGAWTPANRRAAENRQKHKTRNNSCKSNIEGHEQKEKRRKLSKLWTPGAPLHIESPQATMDLYIEYSVFRSIWPRFSTMKRKKMPVDINYKHDHTKFITWICLGRHGKHQENSEEILHE